MTIQERAQKLTADHLGVDPALVVPTANLRDDLGADSLDAIELAMGCEVEFSCEITDQQQERLETFQDLLDVLTASGAK